MLLQKHNIKITTRTVQRYKNTYANRIQDAIDKLTLETQDIPIANERVRLSREEMLYRKSQTLEKAEDSINLGLRCLDAARNEFKSNTDGATYNVQFNQFNNMSNAELLKRKKVLEAKIVGFSKKPQEELCQKVER